MFYGLHFHYFQQLNLWHSKVLSRALGPGALLGISHTDSLSVAGLLRGALLPGRYGRLAAVAAAVEGRSRSGPRQP